MAEAPLIIVVEDEYYLQGIVEDHQVDSTRTFYSSGEEALMLFRGKIADYRALVTDANPKARAKVDRTRCGCPKLKL